MSGRSCILAFQLSLLCSPVIAQRGALRCDHGPGRGLITGVSVTLPYDSMRAFAAIDTVLRTLGYQIDTIRTRPGLWVTMPSFQWPRATERESWHGDRNPGIQLFVTASRKGDSTLLNVAVRVLCIVDNPEQDDRPGSAAQTLKVTATMQVASEVTTYLKKAP